MTSSINLRLPGRFLVLWECKGVGTFWCSRSLLVNKPIILSRVTFPGAPSYGGVKTWIEGSPNVRGPRVG